MSPDRAIGCETPRIFTPPLRELTPDTTLGFAVIEFATDVLEIQLRPWQRWLLVHALELGEDGLFRFRTVVVLVARQNGKSLLSQVLSLFFLCVLGTALVIGTAQDLDIAEEIWQGAVDIVDEVPALAALKRKVIGKNGSKALVLKGGEKYKVKAANRGAGRGLSGDLILLDELREHKSWDAWGAITKTTMARENAQIWSLSNAGDVASIVLRYLRRMAHGLMGDPDGILAADRDQLGVEEEEPEDAGVEDDSLGLFEWSAHPGCDIWDRQGWAQANPSLGYGITERAIRSAAATDPEWVFRTEVLCQWSEGTLDSVFPPGAWDRGTDDKSEIRADGDLYACVDVSWNRSVSHVVVAGRTAGGLVHVEVVASRAGTDWVLPWLTDDARPKWAGVTVQSAGAPASSLLEKLLATDLPVIPWAGGDIGKAHGDLFDLVSKDQVRHRPQPLLDVAARTAVTRPIGDGLWAFDRRRSPRDCSPLVGVVGSTWLLQRIPDQPKHQPKVHEWPEELLEQMGRW